MVELCKIFLCVYSSVRVCLVLFYSIFNVLYQLGWSPCHHSVAHPRVADGRDDLQLWRLAANILNKQPRTNARGSPPAWGLRVRLTTPHRKKQICYEMLQKASDLDGFFGSTTQVKEYGHEIWNMEYKEFV
jgi:hypothetical protein